MPIRKAPNTEKLFVYLQKSQWHNVSPNFSGFVRKEFTTNIDSLEEDEENFKNLHRMIEYSELGRFSEAKTIIDPAYKEFQDMTRKLEDMQLAKQYNYSPRRDTHKPNAQLDYDYSPRRDGSPRREMANQGNRNTYPANQYDAPHLEQQYRGQQHNKYPAPQQEMNDKGQHPPPHHNDHNDPHRANYDNLRLNSPEKTGKHSSRLQTPNDARDNRPHNQQPQPELGLANRPPSNRPPSERYDRNVPGLKIEERQGGQTDVSTHRPTSERGPQLRIQSDRDGQRQHPIEPQQKQYSPKMMTANHRALDQKASSKELWGQDFGDLPSEKVGNSTYRREYPSHHVDNHERLDKERYRDNFGSADEKKTWNRLAENDANYMDDRKEPRRADSADTDGQRPSELARRFKDIFNNEWRDAHDEICKEYGSEKTVRHLLWIVTEAFLVACNIADVQLRELEKQAFGVMATPETEHRNEAHITAVEIASTQLRDLERSSVGVMTYPGNGDPKSRSVGLPRNLGETLPSSKTLLLKYRKQTAVLSLPYVKEECRKRISQTLLDQSRFSQKYLNDGTRLVNYIYKCAELVWLMCVQEPPIVLEYITKETEGARFNHEHYSEYTRGGKMYDYGVWPMLRLDKKGPILARGVAQGI